MSLIRQYDWTLHLMTIATCAYFVARAATTYFGGVLEALPEMAGTKAVAPLTPTVKGEEEASDLESYRVIAERNIFNSAESEVLKENSSEGINVADLGDLGPAVKTSLTIQLLGTMMVDDGTDRRSSAVVSGGEGDKSVDTYYPGDEKSFAPNVQLTKVMKDRIEFVHGSRLEYAELVNLSEKRSIFASAEEVHGKGTLTPGEAPAAPVEGGSRITLDQAEIDRALQNLDALYRDVRIVPNFKDGKQSGFKILSVKPTSVVAKLGVRRGDVLQKINGEELDMQKGMQLFSEMKDLKNFSLEIERGGKNQTLEYEIK